LTLAVLHRLYLVDEHVERWVSGETVETLFGGEHGMLEERAA
jgi:hypothetical protein